MTEPRDQRVYLEDILDAIDKAESFVGDLSAEEFAQDPKTAFAVIRALEIIGEAAKHVPDHIRDRSPGIPWRSITGMRDKLIHSYSAVDLEVVWRTVHTELPLLRRGIEVLLESHEG